MILYWKIEDKVNELFKSTDPKKAVYDYLVVLLGSHNERVEYVIKEINNENKTRIRK